MKFLVDAQSPKALVDLLKYKGFDAIHTKELPNANLTEDKEIIELSVKENRIVISKDADFYNSYILNGTPPKLLMIKTGNIVNKELVKLFSDNLAEIITLLTTNHVVEIRNDNITVLH